MGPHRSARVPRSRWRGTNNTSRSEGCSGHWRQTFGRHGLAHLRPVSVRSARLEAVGKTGQSGRRRSQMPLGSWGKGESSWSQPTEGAGYARLPEVGPQTHCADKKDTQYPDSLSPSPSPSPQPMATSRSATTLASPIPTPNPHSLQRELSLSHLCHFRCHNHLLPHPPGRHSHSRSHHEPPPRLCQSFTNHRPQPPGSVS